jgi:hypothetical protein
MALLPPAHQPDRSSTARTRGAHQKIERKTSTSQLARRVSFLDTDGRGQRMFCRVILGLLCAISLAAEASAAALIEETLRNGHVILHLAGRLPCSMPRWASSPRPASILT